MSYAVQVLLRVAMFFVVIKFSRYCLRDAVRHFVGRV